VLIFPRNFLKLPRNTMFFMVFMAVSTTVNHMNAFAVRCGAGPPRRLKGLRWSLRVVLEAVQLQKSLVDVIIIK
jgi:hypothetical protein